jgi:hypothetical protein
MKEPQVLVVLDGQNRRRGVISMDGIQLRAEPPQS